MSEDNNNDIEDVKNNLLRELEFLNNPNNIKIMNDNLFTALERKVGNDRKEFYLTKDSVVKFYKEAIRSIQGKTSSDDIAINMVKRYANRPFGIFEGILNLKVSDIFIVSDRISMTKNNSDAATEIIIPDELIGIYSDMVDKFITLTVYASNLENTKFDRKNAILDYTSAGMRFNVAHTSLNASIERPIISIRKQLVKSDNTITLDDDYIKSIGLDGDRLEFVNSLATSGSYCVFGETGSGKTTLLKYMGAYKIEDKRNLITIEDTPELFLPVNISYLTNDNFKIQDLFKVSLRENPSHVIVGETRGAEIVDILESALVFCCGTSLHANSFQKLIMRIVYMVKSSKSEYNTDDINDLITATMDGFVYMKNRQAVEVWKRKSASECAEHVHNALMCYERVM